MAEPATDEPSRARTEVVLGIIGLRAEAQRDSLVGLLQAELGSMSLSLVERPPVSSSLSAWASDAARSKRTLLAILLDARGDQGWRVVVIDAARGRAIVRDLPGGIRQDAASIEAVVSIAVSAASALGEGLEVASSPLEAVVGGSPTRTPAPAPRADVSPIVPDSSRTPAPFLRGSVGVSSASFSSEALTTSGVALAIGVDWRARFEARVFGNLFWPARVHTSLGEFGVNRAMFGVAGGPVLRLGALSLVPEAGVVAERLQRSETTPVAGVVATEASALHRVGAVLALRLRLPLIRPVSAELVTGAAYFGQSVQFSTTAPGSRLAHVWPVAAIAQLGLDIATR